MQGPTLGPFLGSMPSPDLGGARLARLLDVTYSGLAILAAVSVWLGAWLTAPFLDIPVVVIASCGMLLIAAGAGVLLMGYASGWERLRIVLMWRAVEERLFGIASRRAVRLAPSDSVAPGIAGLVEALIERLQARKTPAHRGGATSDDAFRNSYAEGQLVVSSLYLDADLLAEASSEIQASAEGLSSECLGADKACEGAEASVSQVIERVTALTGAVGATTAEVQRVSASAIALSDRAFAGQRSVAGLDDHTATLMVAIERVEEALGRMGHLAHSASVEAARGGEGAAGLAPIVTGIQALAAGTRAAIHALQTDVAAMSSQAAEASATAQEICEQVKAHHELGLALSHAVRQQGQEIAGILHILDAARSGIVTLRASVQAVTRHGTARLAKSDSLRETAARLPGHADAMARILRDLPDLVPSPGFDF